MAHRVFYGLSRSLLPSSISSSSKIIQDGLWHMWYGNSLPCYSAIDRKNIKTVQLCPTVQYSTARETARSKKVKERIQVLTSRLEKKPKAKVWRNMTVKELSEALNEDQKKVIQATKNYIKTGMHYRKETDVINDLAVIESICKLFGHLPQFIKHEHQEKELEDNNVYPRPPPDPEVLVKRPPVVTIMGHVDHGKTTLLDSLRNANVVASEFGGITQHIGAFSVKVTSDDRVTFIDTPGHAAFTSMRARGAHATDIVVLVVAADDGVMEQTIESIRMAREANVPIIVAINKIDKPLADIKRTEEMLARQGVYTESMNGDVQAIPISALQGTNLDTLIEAIILQSEFMELKADPTGFVEGIILESRQDPHRGKLASAIIRRGTLRKGAVLVAGTTHAKVRVMLDEAGNQLSDAPPSTPVEMMGWRDLPSAGEVMLEVESEKRAHSAIRYRETLKQQEKDNEVAEIVAVKQKQDRQEYINQRKEALAKGRFSRIKEAPKRFVPDDSPRVNVIIKGDVDGSVEAILDVLETYNSNEVPLHIINYGVGDATENDVEMAKLFKAIVYCFNVKTSAKLSKMAKENGVSLRPVNVIYRLVDDLKEEISSQMPSYEEEEIIGEGDVLQQFEFTEKKKKTIIIGLRVKKGDLVSSDRFKLIRNEEVLFDGHVSSMRHLKNEVKSLKSGFDGGIVLKDSTVPIQLGDIVVCYRLVSKRKKLDWNPGF